MHVGEGRRHLQRNHEDAAQVGTTLLQAAVPEAALIHCQLHSITALFINHSPIELNGLQSISVGLNKGLGTDGDPEAALIHSQLLSTTCLLS